MPGAKNKIFGSIIFCIIAPVSAFGEGAVSQQSLLTSVEQARREVEAEKQRIAREEAAQEKQLEQITAKQGQLVDEKVELKFSIAAKEAELEKLQSDHESLLQQRDRFRQQRGEIRIISGDAHQKLLDLIDTLPPSQSRPHQQKLLAANESSLQNAETERVDIEPTLGLIESLLDESRSSEVFTAQIRNAQGYEEAVELLRAGQMLFAYRSPTTGQTVIAAGAQEDKGYRWNEDIPHWARQRIADTIDSVLSKDGGVYALPLDVTGQLTVEQYRPENFWQRTAAGGPVMIPLGIVAALALALIMERLIFLGSQSGGAIKVAEDILAVCHRGDYQKAEELAVSKPSVISRTLLACLSRRLEGTAIMEDAISEAILHELPRVERFLSFIAILAGVAPLLGLLGTVTGMIATFDAITVFGSGQPRLMAGGISEALITTVTGLVIAIPVLLLHNYLSSRSDKLIADTERFAATLLNLLRDEVVRNGGKETGARR